MDIAVGQELFLPYGFLFWWKRRLTLSSTLLGQCARAYPEFSTRLNAGHEKHTFSEKYWSKKHNKQAPKVSNNKRTELVDASMWAHFPSPRATLDLRTYDPITLKKMKNKKRLTSAFCEWRRVPTAVRDTFEDMEDVTHTNAGMLLKNGVHDIKLCTWWTK